MEETSINNIFEASNTLHTNREIYSTQDQRPTGLVVSGGALSPCLRLAGRTFHPPTHLSTTSTFPHRPPLLPPSTTTTVSYTRSCPVKTLTSSYFSSSYPLTDTPIHIFFFSMLHLPQFSRLCSPSASLTWSTSTDGLSYFESNTAFHTVITSYFIPNFTAW